MKRFSCSAGTVFKLYTTKQEKHRTQNKLNVDNVNFIHAFSYKDKTREQP